MQYSLLCYTFSVIIGYDFFKERYFLSGLTIIYVAEILRKLFVSTENLFVCLIGPIFRAIVSFTLTLFVNEFLNDRFLLCVNLNNG